MRLAEEERSRRTSDRTSRYVQCKTSLHEACAVEEQPEHRNDRRRFICWSLMLGLIPPQRLVERVIAEIEAETEAPA